MQVESLEDLTPAIELYNTLIGLGRYDDAYTLFRTYKTSHALPSKRQPPTSRTSGNAIPRWVGSIAALEQRSRHNPMTLNVLAQGYHFSGQPGRAVLVVTAARQYS